MPRKLQLRLWLLRPRPKSHILTMRISGSVSGARSTA